MGIIYVATNKVNGKKYIGKTVGKLEHRRARHEKAAREGLQLYFLRALRKYGFENFEWKVVVEWDADELHEVEIMFIERWGTKCPDGYNLTDGGEGFRGLTRTEEHRRKISESIRTVWQSEEYKKRLREVLKERVWNSVECRRKIGLARKGHLVLPSTRAKISESVEDLWDSEEYRELQCQAHRTEEFRENMSRIRRGEGNGQSKFTEDEVIEIRKVYSSIENKKGLISKLARQHNVTNSAIESIISGRTWKHLLETKDQ